MAIFVSLKVTGAIDNRTGREVFAELIETPGQLGNILFLAALADGSFGMNADIGHHEFGSKQADSIGVGFTGLFGQLGFT